MQVNYTGDAFASLLQLINFIESKNTTGAGLRWLNRLESFLVKSLINPALAKDCQNQTFRKLKLKCLNYNDWVIAFSIQKGNILIEAMLHKSRIID